jgi:hypothetical protein
MKMLTYVICLFLVFAMLANTANAELVAYWTLDETAGTIAYDSAGTNDGTLVNNPVWVDGKISGALNFNGTQGVYINGSSGYDSPLNMYNSNMTVAAWIKPIGGGTIVARAKPHYITYRLYSDGKNVGINTYRSPTHWLLSTGDILVPGNWYHVVGIFDRVNDTGIIYVNGVEQVRSTQMTADPYSCDAPTKIGCRSAAGEFAYNGAIDDVRIYNTALTADEVRQLYTSYFNTAPIANAGKDQRVYAGLDGKAAVTLDGSDSNDPENDTLTYIWSYIVDGQIYEANGVKPTLVLPAGTHTITLVVNDGEYDSEPDDVNVAVVGPLKVDMKLLPVLHWQPFKLLTAEFKFLQHLDEQIDPYSIALAADPNVKADYFELSVYHDSILRCNAGFANVSAPLVKSAATTKIFGSFRSGRLFYGEDTIKVVPLGSQK